MTSFRLFTLFKILGILLTTSPLHSATFTVDTAIDENNVNPSNLSLREAIAAASNNDIITFDPSLSGKTISLQHGQLNIATGIQIDASPLSHGVTIDANHSSRVFDLFNSTNNFIAVSLDKLTLLNGLCPTNENGGALRVRTYPANPDPISLFVNRCHFGHNATNMGSGTALSASGNITLSISKSSFTDNVQLNPNSAQLPVPATILANGLSSNTAISDSTIACNDGHAIGSSDSAFNLSFSTVAFNKGHAIAANATFSQCILAANGIANTGSITPNFATAFNLSSNGYNILGDPNLSFAQNTDIIDNDPGLYEPMLRGGTTYTCAFRPYSPAVDAGNPNIVYLFDPLDQRGFTRFRNGDNSPDNSSTPDIGAFELGETIIVNTEIDENNTNPANTSLREALSLAATAGPGTRIELPANYFGFLQHGELVVRSTVWIDNPHASLARIQPHSLGSAHRLIRFEGANLSSTIVVDFTPPLSNATPHTLTVQGLRFLYGEAPLTNTGPPFNFPSYHFGGCIAATLGDHLNLLESELASGEASGQGGGLATHGTTYLGNCSVRACRNTAIITSSSLVSKNCIFEFNEGTEAGVIQATASGSLIIEHSTFYKNSSTADAGAITSPTASIGHSIFFENTSDLGPPMNNGNITSLITTGPNCEDGSSLFGADNSFPHLLNTDPKLNLFSGTTGYLTPIPFESPVIDLGPTAENSTLCLSADLAGNPRFRNGTAGDFLDRSDLGALESLRAISVTTNTDVVNPNDNLISLREAVALANTNPDEDIITFSAAPSPFKLTLNPAFGELSLSTPIQIIGANHSCYFTEISGNNQTRLFRISSNTILRNLTLSHGSASQGGALYLADSSELELSACYFKHNTAQQGGAIFDASGAYSLFWIEKSAFAYNQATGSLSSQSHGGAIYFSEKDLIDHRISSSTFFRNSAGNQGAAIYWETDNGGSLGVNHLTFVANEGDGTVAGPEGIFIGNSIFAQNSPRSFPITQTFRFPPENNLIDQPHPNIDPADNNLIVDPLLKPFGDYGGPTPTLALTNGSPAIDHTPFSASDQRGTETQDGDNDSTVKRDAGAFEFVPPIIVTTNTDEQDGPMVGGLSLREAIQQASGTLHALIQFDPSLDGSTINLLTPDPLSSYTEALNVPLGSSITIDASTLPNGITITDDINEVPPHIGLPGAHDLIRFNLATSSFDDSYLGLENITFTNASIHALNLAGNHHRIHNCLFKDNSELGGTSSLYNNGHLELSNSTFLNNASGRGGAFFNDGFGTIAQCTFNNNTAAEGGVVDNGGCLTFANCTFVNNTAQDIPILSLTAAGAIAHQNSFGLSQTNQSANITFKNCLFDDPITTALFASDSQFPGTITSLGRNLTRSVVPDLNHPNDLTSSDTLLEPFATTPLPGSFPLIPMTDAVDTIIPTLSDPIVDQRGYRRPLDGNGDGFTFSDIGAVEASPVILVDTDLDEDDGIGNGAGTSLRDAVAVMNARNYDEMPVIGFAPHLDGATIQLNAGPGGEILLSAEQEIDASSLTNGITIAGSRTASSGDFRVFQANAPGETIRLNCLTIEQGWANDWGGGLLVENSTACILTDCTVRDSFAVNLGGGISVRSTSFLSLERSTLSGNQCANLGGGLGVEGGLVQAINSTISGNHAENGGGGIADVTLSDIDLQHTTIVNNTATTGGGGIDLTQPSVRATHTILAENTPGNFEKRSPAGDISSFGYNLDDGTNSEFILATDRTAVPDAMISPLANNGGRTQTHALLFNSPAIDAGDPNLAAGGLLVTDQTGQKSRVMDGDYLAPDTIDIGAFEFDVNTLPPDMDGDCIPNGAEVAMGFDPQDPADGLADQDGDLVPAGKEWLAGTDDNDPTSKFEMLSVVDLSGVLDEFEIAWSSVNNPEVTYDLELTEDGYNWIPFESGIPATGPTTLRVVPWISSTNNLYFRVKADRTWP